MQTLKIELTGNNSLKALKELEYRNLIRIMKEPDLQSYALPGESISESDFKNWIEYAEESPIVSLTVAKKDGQRKRRNSKNLCVKINRKTS